MHRASSLSVSLRHWVTWKKCQVRCRIQWVVWLLPTNSIRRVNWRQSYIADGYGWCFRLERKRISTQIRWTGLNGRIGYQASPYCLKWSWKQKRSSNQVAFDILFFGLKRDWKTIYPVRCADNCHDDRLHCYEVRLCVWRVRHFTAMKTVVVLMRTVVMEMRCLVPQK